MVSKEYLDSLERQYKSSEKKPPADIMSRRIAEEYKGKLAYDGKKRQWMRYEADLPGEWSVETDAFMEHIIHQILLSKGFACIPLSYLSNVKRFLKLDLDEDLSMRVKDFVEKTKAKRAG